MMKRLLSSDFPTGTIPESAEDELVFLRPELQSEKSSSLEATQSLNQNKEI